MNARLMDVQVRCLQCRRWFRPPATEFEEMTKLFELRTQCPHCGEMTACNASNFHALSENGRPCGVQTDRP